MTDLPAIRGLTIRDHLAEIGTALVATAPFAGGIAHLLATYRDDRFARWAEAVETELGEVSSAALSDDRFLDACRRATEIAVETKIDEKLHILAAALHELVDNPDDWADETTTRMFLMIERFTPRHIHAMQLLNAVTHSSSIPKDKGQFAFSALRAPIIDGQSVISVADGDPALQMAIVRDLDDFDLIDPQMASGAIVFGGQETRPVWYRSSALSVEGQQLLRFLRYYTPAN